MFSVIRRELLVAILMLLLGARLLGAEDLATTLQEGRDLAAVGRLDDAIAFFESALESGSLADPRENAALATEIARLHHQAGRDADAERFYGRCVEIVQAAGGPQDPAAAACRYNLAGLAFEAGRHDAAKEHYRAAFEAWRQSLGPSHAYTLAAGEKLALLLRLESSLEESAPLYEELISAHETHHGEADPSLPALLQALATVELERGRTAVAETHLHRALDILRQGGNQGGDRPLETAGALAHLAIVETRLGVLEEAEKHYRESLALYDRHAPDHPDAAATRNNLALVYVEAGRDEDAEPLLRRSLDAADKTGDPVALVPTLANLAALYDRLDRRAESLTMTRRAVAILGPQLELIARRDPARLGPHESLWYELALLHRKNLEQSGELASASPVPDLGHPHDEGPEYPAAPEDPYWAQIGSRHDDAEARRDLEALAGSFPELLSGLPHRLQRVDLGTKGVWHRMQFGPFESRTAAARLCAQLAERGYGECLVVREPRAESGEG